MKVDVLSPPVNTSDSENNIYDSNVNFGRLSPLNVILPGISISKRWILRNFSIISPLLLKIQHVLYSLSPSRSGMEPPIRKTSLSLKKWSPVDFTYGPYRAASERAWVLSPPGISSAYSGKYLVPYGELKHSGKVTNWAPWLFAY